MIESTSAKEDEKFLIPEHWRERCEILRLSPKNRHEFIPLQSDLLRCLNQIEYLDFKLYLAVGWDLVEFLTPQEFKLELVKELLDVHRKWPTQTRICVQQESYPRYEKLANKYRRERFETSAGENASAYEMGYRLYAELGSASQTVSRGALGQDNFYRVTHSASHTIMNMSSTKDITRFLVDVVSKDPILYDHAAATALLAGTIAWNVLELPKRESKLTVQAALLHDAEKNCDYLFRPKKLNVISANAIQEIEGHRAAGIDYHETTVTVMTQYREWFAGGGYPGKLKGRYEVDPVSGILRMSRVISIACAFSEYLLKRVEKIPLTLDQIKNHMLERSATELDPDIVKQFLGDFTTGVVRRHQTSKEIDN